MKLKHSADTHVLEEHVEFWVRLGVVRCLKQREEDVVENLLEVGAAAGHFVHVTVENKYSLYNPCS